MKIDLHKIHHDLSDSLKDVTEWMTPMTDMEHPNLHEVHAVSQVIKNLSKAIHCLDEDGYGGEYYLDGGCWSDCTNRAMCLFKDLEKHYMCFWKAVEAYKKCPTEEAKHKMIEHFNHQLMAHDAIATFVMSDCPKINPELHESIKAWMAKKAAKPNAMMASEAVK